MRLKISHRTTYRYETPATGIIQLLRLTPRNHDGQYVVRWRIDVSADCRLAAHEDAFGNITHNFTLAGPVTALDLQIDGEVETQDTDGTMRGTLERFPPSLFLRETALTQADEAIKAYAWKVRRSTDGDVFQGLHELLQRLNRDITFDANPTHAQTRASEAFALKRGVCQDLTHIFIACARTVGIPARYVGGYFNRADGVVAQDAGHAWAEAFVPDLGWVAFDPANGICATDAHVRVAVGLDYLGASPVRGSHFGGAGESLSVAVHVAQAELQMQN